MNYEQAAAIGPSLMALALRSGRASFAPKPVPPKPTSKPSAAALPGELTLKEWIRREAEGLGVAPHAIEMRLARSYYPELRLRRVNKRVIFVRISPHSAADEPKETCQENQRARL